jgi:hypothetical protein
MNRWSTGIRPQSQSEVSKGLAILFWFYDPTLFAEMAQSSRRETMVMYLFGYVLDPK